MSEHPHLPGTRWDSRMYDDDGSRHEPDVAELLEQAHEIMARARRNGARGGRNGPQDSPGSNPASEGTPDDGAVP